MPNINVMCLDVFVLGEGVDDWVFEIITLKLCWSGFLKAKKRDG